MTIQPKRVVLIFVAVGCMSLCLPAQLLAQCGAGYVGLNYLLSQDSVDVVFSGTVASVQRAGITETVTFDVDRVWKGSVDTRTAIYRRIPVAVRESEFHPTIFEDGHSYVVIAHRLSAAERTELGVANVLGTDMCGSGSRPLALAQEELRAIGSGHSPRPVAIRNPRIERPRKVYDARPVWPEAARRADVRGTVIVEFVIATDGSVTDARILRGVPLLDEAALECVRQWKYEPVLLNGRAIPVVMTAAVPVP